MSNLKKSMAALALLLVLATSASAVVAPIWTYNMPEGSAPYGLSGPYAIPGFALAANGGNLGFANQYDAYGSHFKAFYPTNGIHPDGMDGNRWVQLCTVMVHLCPPPTDANAKAFVVILPGDGGGPSWDNPIWIGPESDLATGSMWYTFPVNRNQPAVFDVDYYPPYDGLTNLWPKRTGWDEDGVWVNKLPFDASGNPRGAKDIYVFAVITEGWTTAFQNYDNNGVDFSVPANAYFHKVLNSITTFDPPGDLLIKLVFQPHDVEPTGITVPYPIGANVWMSMDYQNRSAYVEPNVIKHFQIPDLNVPSTILYDDVEFVDLTGNQWVDNDGFVDPWIGWYDDGGAWWKAKTSIFMNPRTNYLVGNAYNVPVYEGDAVAAPGDPALYPDFYSMDRYTWRGDRCPENDTKWWQFHVVEGKKAVPIKKLPASLKVD